MADRGTNDKPQVIFREVQYPRQWWIMLIVVVVTVMIWYVFIAQIIFGREIGEDPMPDWLAVVFWVAFGWLFPLGWLAARLELEVRPDAVHIRYVPFMARTIDYGAIVSVQAETYQPVREFGGWGIRMWFTRRHIAYSVRGDTGVRLELHGGRTVLVGSQQPQALANAIQAQMAHQQSL